MTVVYTPLPVNDVDDDRMSEKLSAIPKSALHRRPWVLHLGIFSVYTIAFLGFFLHILMQKPEGLKENCLLETSAYCAFQCFQALLNADLLHLKRLHIRLLNIPSFGLMAPWNILRRIKDTQRQPLTRPGTESPQTIHVSHISLEMDHTFQHTWAVRPIRISDDELEKINKGRRASNVRYKEADGGGNMGSIEIFHQLHCLVRPCKTALTK